MKRLATISLLLFTVGLTPPRSPAAEPEPAAVQEIRDAFARGGPLVSCWNAEGGWNLRQQVAWIEAGHHYYPTIYCPLPLQGGDKPAKWERWFAENREALDKLNRWKLPICVRWHNWLNEFTDVPIGERGPFETSPLVHGRMPGGELNSRPVVDPLGPLAPWSELGRRLAACYFVNQLAAALPDCPQVFWLENNEAAQAALAEYALKLAARDEWGVFRRAWKSDLETLNLRVADYARTHTPSEAESEFARRWRAKRQELNAAIKANAPAPWRGKITIGGYGGVGDLRTRGLGGRWSYRRPEEDYARFPFGAEIDQFDEGSERCYDDGSGSPQDWHDWVRGPHVTQHNFSSLLRHLDATRGALWHDDRSFSISQQRTRAAKDEHGGYVLPDRLKGFAIAALWAVKANRRATVLRWFAASQTELSDRWFFASDPAELQPLTHGDYFAQVAAAVDEVWRSPLLIAFWRHGEPILSPDPPLCDWELPAEEAARDDRSRVLYTSADPPRYALDARGRKVDRWRSSDGKLELKVFAQGYRLAGPDGRPLDLIYAWSPRQNRENVVVEVPGRGPVLFDRVDPDGEWRLAL